MFTTSFQSATTTLVETTSAACLESAFGRFIISPNYRDTSTKSEDDHAPIFIEKDNKVYVVRQADRMAELFQRFCSIQAAPTPILPEKRQPKVIFHFIRHAQALHNVKDGPGFKIRDPGLTLHGIQQCISFQRDFPHMDKISHVISSPMRRTLETTLVSLAPLFSRGINIIAWKDLREHGKARCNDGTPLGTLKEEMKGLPIKWSLLQEGWESSEDSAVDHTTRAAARVAREQRVRRKLYELAQVAINGGVWKGIEFEAFRGDGNLEIAVISHGGFLSKLAGFQEQEFHNMQCKSFKFASAKRIQNGAHNHDLIQKKASLSLRHFRLPELHLPELRFGQLSNKAAKEAERRMLLKQQFEKITESLKGAEERERKKDK